MRDLGVILDLNFIEHTNKVINEANEMLGFKTFPQRKDYVLLFLILEMSVHGGIPIIIEVFFIKKPLYLISTRVFLSTQIKCTWLPVGYLTTGHKLL